MSRGANRPDFAARLKSRLRGLRARVQQREALETAIREANLTLDPRGVAQWLVGAAQGCIPATCWAVVAHDVNGELAVNRLSREVRNGSRSIAKNLSFA